MEATGAQGLLDRWMAMSNTYICDAEQPVASETSRTSTAFESEYYCVMYLVGPSARRGADHPYAEVQGEPASVSNVDIDIAVAYVKSRYAGPAIDASAADMLAWARRMRAAVLLAKTRGGAMGSD